jgi:hypothetical protein
MRSKDTAPHAAKIAVEAILRTPNRRRLSRQDDVSVNTFSLPTRQVCTVAVNARSPFVTPLFRFHCVIDPAVGLRSESIERLLGNWFLQRGTFAAPG